MSLDVSLIYDKPVERRGTGVFIREDGKQRELSAEEVSEKWPGAEVPEQKYMTHELYSANITHNLGKMAKEAGLYMALWRPDELGIKTAKELIPLIESDLPGLKEHPEVFKKFSPENGWGTYEGFVEFVEGYLEACKQYPYARVEVSR